MEVLNPDVDLDRFFATLAAASESVLMLDYDGTLAPFRTERDRALPYPAIREPLQQLVHLPRVRPVIITGRWTRDLIPLLNLSPLPEIWGCHGAERLLPDGTHHVAELPRRAADLLSDLAAWLESQGWQDLTERKPTSLAIHWRGRPPELADTITRLVHERWGEPIRAAGLELLPFDGGLEVRSGLWNKGHAVRTILSQLSPGTPAAYLGDDTTDEDAFAALGDRGLKVLVRDRPRPSRADIRLEPPHELETFLRRWVDSAR